ncbi:hypothetical protein [Nostoc sp. 'Lobaria pulmonaria (5183) cyanobiont']|uniref:hypothetical protein n=1 Tax=Nostoc sp. 'Lobaria pulmonaria (5183) cyanobiont' TaxID=1618022 RepID=UPI00131A44B5|nr:hypothetical protein [Nostoc sp. 'Lobaria pulmonaria (5183) cyanobiont']
MLQVDTAGRQSSQVGKPFRQFLLGETPLALASPFGRRPDCRPSYVANAALTPRRWLTNALAWLHKLSLPVRTKKAS